ncbi:MAG: transketolase C-terminal domain-containing protein [Candidatus Gastranaerophilaceae bacterium]
MQKIWLVDTISNLIEQEAKDNEDIYFVHPDGLGLLITPNFKNFAPKRIISCGISEQNLISFATGLAAQGKTVYCFMLTAFMVHRALDQLKMACYSNVNIKFLAYYPDIARLYEGYSHSSADAIAIIKNTPNLEILTPTTDKETEYAIKSTFSKRGPQFILISNVGIAADKDINEVNDFNVILKGSKKCAILTYGNSMEYITRCANFIDKLYKQRIYPTIISAFRLQPFNDNMCEKIIDNYDNIVTFEAMEEGALASFVARIIAQKKKKVNFLPIYLKNPKYTIIGNWEYITSELSENKILHKKIIDFVNKNKNLLQICLDFIYTKEFYYDKNSNDAIKIKILNIPLLKLIKRNQIKKGKLKHKVYIFGIRIL